MISIDDRRGSKELAPLFKRFSIPTRMERMDSGDMSWTGWGPGNKEVAITVERKTLPDLIQSMTSARLNGDQTVKMCRQYDYGYVVTEGIWKPDSDGQVLNLEGEVWKPTNISYQGLCNFLNSMAVQVGLNMWRTTNKYETVEWLVATYKWWQKRWTDHSTNSAVYRGMAAKAEGKKLGFDFKEASIVEIVALCLDGVGPKTAADMDGIFKSVQDLADADEEELRLVVGEKTAKKILNRWKWKRRNGTG